MIKTEIISIDILMGETYVFRFAIPGTHSKCACDVSNIKIEKV